MSQVKSFSSINPLKGSITLLGYANELVNCAEESNASIEPLLHPLIRFRLDPSAAYHKWLNPTAEKVRGLLASLEENQNSPLLQLTTFSDENQAFENYIKKKYDYRPMRLDLLESLTSFNKMVLNQYLNALEQKITPSITSITLPLNSAASTSSASEMTGITSQLANYY